MFLNPMQHQAQLVTYTEIATAHESFTAGGMFDGSMGNVTSTIGATQAVTLNAKYAGWKVVGVRYIRQNHNNQVKNEGIKTARLDIMGEDGVWRGHATLQFPWGEYNSLVDMKGNPIAPIIMNSKRQYRIVAQAAWSGSSIHWLEFQLVVGYA